MAHPDVRYGLDPRDAAAPVAVLRIEPDGSPGERALNAYAGYAHEWGEEYHLLQTDGWAEQARADGRLTVAVAAGP